jgi:multiple sugar transport system permease protein
MCISVIAAYSLRMRFFGSAALAAGVFLTYLVPDTLFIPLFKVLGTWDC